MDSRIIEAAERRYVVGMEWAMSTTHQEQAPSRKDIRTLMASMSEAADLWTTFRTTGPAVYYQVGVGLPFEQKVKGKLYAAAASLATARPESASYIFCLGEDLWWGVVVASGILVPSTDAASGDGGDIVASSREELNHRMPFASLDASAENYEYTDPEEALGFLEGVFTEAGKTARIHSLTQERRVRRHLTVGLALSVAALMGVGGLSYWHHERMVARRQARLAAQRAAAARARRLHKKHRIKKVSALVDAEKQYEQNVTRPWEVAFKPGELVHLCRQAYWQTYVVSQGGWEQNQWQCSAKGVRSVWNVLPGGTIATAPKGKINSSYTQDKTQAKLPGQAKPGGWDSVAKLDQAKRPWVIRSQTEHGLGIQIVFGNDSSHVLHWPKQIKQAAKKLGQSLPANKVLWHEVAVTVHTTVPPWDYTRLWDKPGFVIRNIRTARGKGWTITGVQYGY